MRPDYGKRARALVGTQFRPQGRDRSGLDCVGLLMATYGIPVDRVRRNYRVKGDHRREAEQVLAQHFRRVPPGQALSGDALLFQIARDQLHFGVWTDAGFVHAHAGLKRVVETPGFPEWPLIAVYRKRARERSS
jgi:hypothetical protein